MCRDYKQLRKGFYTALVASRENRKSFLAKIAQKIIAQKMIRVCDLESQTLINTT